MSHDYHPGLPGYHPDQILIDGCQECEHRVEVVERALGNLDHKRFAAAWLRAADTFASTPPSGVKVPLGERSVAEMPLLTALWGVQVHLQRMGLPLGWLPVGMGSLVAGDIEWSEQTAEGGDRHELTVALPAKVPIR